MSLNLIGGASGVCHFSAISGLVLAWGVVGRHCLSRGSLDAGAVSPEHGGLGAGQAEDEGGCGSRRAGKARLF